MEDFSSLRNRNRNNGNPSRNLFTAFMPHVAYICIIDLKQKQYAKL